MFLGPLQLKGYDQDEWKVKQLCMSINVCIAVFEINKPDETNESASHIISY